MKVSIILFPILVGSTMVVSIPATSGNAVLPQESAILNDLTGHGAYCNTTPCFIGCPVGGEFKLCC